MKISNFNLIFFILIIMIIIFMFDPIKTFLLGTEHFQTTDQTNYYQTDVEAIRNLSSIASTLTSSDIIISPGSFNITSDVNITNNLSISGNINASNAIINTRNINTNGPVSISGNLNATTGNTTLGAVSINGGATVNGTINHNTGNLNIRGTVNLNNNNSLNLTNSGSINLVNGAINTKFINSVTDTITISGNVTTDGALPSNVTQPGVIKARALYTRGGTVENPTNQITQFPSIVDGRNYIGGSTVLTGNLSQATGTFSGYDIIASNSFTTNKLSISGDITTSGNINAQNGTIYAKNINITDAFKLNVLSISGDIQNTFGNIHTKSINTSGGTNNNPTGLRTIFSHTDGNNYIRGDTIINGDIKQDTRSYITTSGNIEATNGSITGKNIIATNSFTTIDGNIISTTGNISTSTGQIFTSSGNMATLTGNIITRDGNITTINGIVTANKLRIGGTELTEAQLKQLKTLLLTINMN